MALFTLNNGKIVGSIGGSDDKYLLAKLLLKAMDTLGRPLSFEEARRYPEMPENPNIYAVYFGSLEKACAKAKYYVESVDNPSKGLESLKEPARLRELRAMEYHLKRIRADAEVPELKKWRCNMDARRGEINQAEKIPAKKIKKVAKDDERLWAEIKQKAKLLGHLPTAKEITADPELSSPQTYYNRLGKNWRKTLATELGLEIGEPIIAKERKEETVTKQTIQPEELPVMELPIKIILPKGIKGTVQLTIEL